MLGYPWREFGLGLILLPCLSGCAPPASQPDSKLAIPPDSFSKETVLVEHGETEDSAQLLVREFLQDGEDTGFGYFIYLVFAEQSRVTYNKRLAAATAFMCQHSTISPVGELGLNKSELAVFYAPVKSRTNMNRLARSKAAKSLLKEYNYAGANFLLRQLKTRSTLAQDPFGFTLGIIGSPIPLMTKIAEVDIDEVQVLNLDKNNPYQVARTIQEFQKGLVTGSEAQRGPGGSKELDLATRVRNHFRSVSSMVLPAKSEEGERKDVCL